MEHMFSFGNFRHF